MIAPAVHHTAQKRIPVKRITTKCVFAFSHAAVTPKSGRRVSTPKSRRRAAWTAFAAGTATLEHNCSLGNATSHDTCAMQACKRQPCQEITSAHLHRWTGGRKLAIIGILNRPLLVMEESSHHHGSRSESPLGRRLRLPPFMGRVAVARAVGPSPQRRSVQRVRQSDQATKSTRRGSKKSPLG